MCALSLESVRYSRSPAKARADVSISKRNAVNTGYTLLGPGDVFGEVSFFTEVPMMEASSAADSSLKRPKQHAAENPVCCCGGDSLNTCL
jgi:hypothetical protein